MSVCSCVNQKSLHNHRNSFYLCECCFLFVTHISQRQIYNPVLWQNSFSVCDYKLVERCLFFSRCPCVISRLPHGVFDSILIHFCGLSVWEDVCLAAHNQTNKPWSADLVSYFQTLLPRFHFVCVCVCVCWHGLQSVCLCLFMPGCVFVSVYVRLSWWVGVVVWVGFSFQIGSGWHSGFFVVVLGPAGLGHPLLFPCPVLLPHCVLD